MSSTGTLHERFLQLRKSMEGNGFVAVKKRKLSPHENDQVALKVQHNDGVERSLEDTLQTYKTALEKCQQEEKEKQSEFEDFKGKIDSLRSVYLFGLKSVANLQDLRDAPDAILPGNFPKDDINDMEKK